MRYRWQIWAAVVLLTSVVIVGTKVYPYFPGDLAFARLVQTLAPESPQWAQFVTATAKAPWKAMLVIGSVGAAWWLAGQRGVLLALVLDAARPGRTYGASFIGSGLGALLSLAVLWFVSPQRALAAPALVAAFGGIAVERGMVGAARARIAA